jgi:hypothetical protein
MVREEVECGMNKTLDYHFFYDLAKWSNSAWKGAYSKDEIISNAQDYYSDYKISLEKDACVGTVAIMIDMLKDDDSEGARHFLNEITNTYWNVEE